MQVSYWPEEAQGEITELQPVAVDKERDFTCQIALRELKPNTQYIAEISALSESGTKGQQLAARFKTAPMADQICDVEAVVVTCQGHETIDDPVKGHWVYSHMLSHEPDFFIHLKANMREVFYRAFFEIGVTCCDPTLPFIWII